MFRNESVYPDTDTFNPGRFLKDGQINPDVKDPELQMFGHGRRFFPPAIPYTLWMTRWFYRICPGRHFVLRVLFLAVARILATFDISKSLDEDGNPIVPDEKYTSGGVM